MAPQSTERWGSRLGFVLATAGSAIGLGNIWRFPSMAAANGGGGFVLIYVLIILLVGVPAMMAELALGRRGHSNPVDAFGDAQPGGRWQWAGVLAMVASGLILSYYSVVGGWVLAYLTRSLRGGLAGLDAVGLAAVFDAQVSEPGAAVWWHAVFMLLTFAVVAGGVKDGIERWSKVLMPGLVVLLLVLLLRVLTLEGAMAGAIWFLTPRWADVTWPVVIQATGQVFFSFGLGMGVLITYGSYLNRSEDIPRAAVYVAAADTGVALTAGLIVIPALFAFGLPVQGGPGLLFVTMPGLLARMPLGAVATFLFFLMVATAALTSSVSLLEVVVAVAGQRLRWPRLRTAAAAAAVLLVLGIPSALAQTERGWQIAGRDFLSAVDSLTSDLLLPVGGLLTILFVGWVWGAGPALAELRTGSRGFRTAPLWVFSVRLVIPAALGVILVTRLLGLG